MDKGQRVAVDLDFEDKMSQGELRSLCQQLSYCYSANCNAEKPFSLHYTSLKVRVRCREWATRATEGASCRRGAALMMILYVVPSRQAFIRCFFVMI